jgi:hypothetical protein
MMSQFAFASPQRILLLLSGNIWWAEVRDELVVHGLAEPIEPNWMKVSKDAPVTGGWFWLPPWSAWQDWAKQGLEGAAERMALKGYSLDKYC